MAGQKLTDRTEYIAAIPAEAISHIVTDPSGSPASWKTTLATIVSSIMLLLRPVGMAFSKTASIFLYTTDNETDDYNRLGIYFDERIILASQQAGGFADAKGLDICVQGNGASETHIYMNRPNQAGDTPAFQFWHHSIDKSRLNGVHHFYCAGSAQLIQSDGVNNYFLIEPRYDQTGTASGVDLRVNRKGTNFGSGVQQLMALSTQDDEESPVVDKFTVDTLGNVSVVGFLKLGNAAAAGAIIPTHSLILKDSTGTQYKVPCVLA